MAFHSVSGPPGQWSRVQWSFCRGSCARWLYACRRRLPIERQWHPEPWHRQEGYNGATAAADPKVLASQLQAYCPKVSVRDGTAFFNTYSKAAAPKPKKKAAAADAAAAVDATVAPPDDSAKIIYQASVSDVSRDCLRANGQLTMKVAVAGKVVPGPMFAPGTLTMPIRIAVMHGNDVLYSQLHQYQVQVSDPSAATQFVFTDNSVVVPEPSAKDYQVFAGYDDTAPAVTNKKSGGKKKKRVAAAN